MIRSIFLFIAVFVTLPPASSLAGHGETSTLIQHWQDAYLKANQGVTQKHLNASWAPDDAGFLWKRETSSGWSFQWCDAATGQVKVAFPHHTLAKDLQKILGHTLNPNKLPLQNLQVEGKDASVFLFKIKQSWFRSKDGHLTKISVPQSKPSPSPTPPDIKTNWRSEISPDGKWKATVKSQRVFLTRYQPDKQTPEPPAIGTPIHKGDYYLGMPVWNATSTAFFVNYCEPGQRRVVTLVESSPKGQLQPKTHTHRYDKPGDKIDRVEPHLFPVDGSPCRKPSRQLTKNAFSISNVGWNLSGKELRYEYIERGYGKFYLIGMEATTGNERVICREESDTFIFANGVRYRKDFPKTDELIWGSERDGWRHLYLIDPHSGKVKHQITKGNWVVRSIEYVDPEKREITFTASGKNTGEDPYHIHWYRVRFDGSEMTTFTQGDGTHKVIFSPQRKYYIDSWSRVDSPPVFELHRSSDGQQISELARADISGFLSLGRTLPERFHCKDRNGRFDIWGMIQKPPHFDPHKKYPVIENIYAGPHGAFVPKSFSAWRSHAAELAEEGFIVVNIDGLGTNYRHHDFSHFSYKNIADAGLPDRIKWLKAAGHTRPYMDLSRVGIYGGSAGGQSSTGAVLFHGEFYKAAASDCGCHDNRMDKIWWNEQWMDWPVGDHYAKQSNVTNAHRLTGALMLTVGELDRNVDPSSTLQLVNALIKSDKSFEFHIHPSGGHGSGEQGYLRKKRLEFFQRHLGSAKEASTPTRATQHSPKHPS